MDNIQNTQDFWMKNYERLAEFFKTNKRWPEKDSAGKEKQLYLWSEKQRAFYRDAKIDMLDFKKVQLLNDIQFQWKEVKIDPKVAADEKAKNVAMPTEGREQQWINKYEAVKKFKEEHGGILPKSNLQDKEEMNLYQWIYRNERKIEKGELNIKLKEMFVELMDYVKEEEEEKPQTDFNNNVLDQELFDPFGNNGRRNFNDRDDFGNDRSFGGDRGGFGGNHGYNNDRANFGGNRQQKGGRSFGNNRGGRNGGGRGFNANRGGFKGNNHGYRNDNDFWNNNGGGFNPEDGSFMPNNAGFNPENGNFDQPSFSPEEAKFAPRNGGFDPESGSFGQPNSSFEDANFAPNNEGFSPNFEQAENEGFTEEESRFAPRNGGFNPEDGSFDMPFNNRSQQNSRGNFKNNNGGFKNNNKSYKKQDDRAFRPWDDNEPEAEEDNNQPGRTTYKPFGDNLLKLLNEKNEEEESK